MTPKKTTKIGNQRIQINFRQQAVETNIITAKFFTRTIMQTTNHVKETMQCDMSTDERFI
jgi:hypothetical protein